MLASVVCGCALSFFLLHLPFSVLTLKTPEQPAALPAPPYNFPQLAQNRDVEAATCRALWCSLERRGAARGQRHSVYGHFSFHRVATSNSCTPPSFRSYLACLSPRSFPVSHPVSTLQPLRAYHRLRADGGQSLGCRDPNVTDPLLGCCFVSAPLVSNANFLAAPVFSSVKTLRTKGSAPLTLAASQGAKGLSQLEPLCAVTASEDPHGVSPCAVVPASPHKAFLSSPAALNVASLPHSFLFSSAACAAGGRSSSCVAAAPTSADSAASSPPASSSLELLKKLRALTNSSVSICKEALAASNGDIRGAVDWLRQRGSAAGAAAAAAASLSANHGREGVIAVASWRARVVRSAGASSRAPNARRDGDEATVNQTAEGGDLKSAAEARDGGDATCAQKQGAGVDAEAGGDAGEWEGKVMIKVTCDTDFVARNDQVKSFAQRAATILADLARRKIASRTAVEQSESLGESEYSAPEDSSGTRSASPAFPESGPALVKYLLNASWPSSGKAGGRAVHGVPSATGKMPDEDVGTPDEGHSKRGRLVRDELHFLSSLVGERIVIEDAASLASHVGKGAVGLYLHDRMGDNVGSIGVLVELEMSAATGERGRPAAEQQMRKQGQLGCRPNHCSEARERADKLTGMAEKIGMQVAASKPLAVDVASLDRDLYEREVRACRAQAEGSGKPPAVIEKMVAGRLKKWFKEVVLSEQTWLLDDRGKPSPSVGACDRASGLLSSTPEDATLLYAEITDEQRSNIVKSSATTPYFLTINHFSGLARCRYVPTGRAFMSLIRFIKTLSMATLASGTTVPHALQTFFVDSFGLPIVKPAGRDHADRAVDGLPGDCAGHREWSKNEAVASPSA
ncbi:putative elongation factor TS [Besnoitia besnoiti]|uniref:Putative elongation factor TS n=1 Tax=Besnoitia besnoiti TaxID=94643 RepID=A0A2A9M854_BESBE|nr:putative elongation factor TS [Besnoitia besnoiti]PFH31572.1 putative elongation factor TS [Besnoitia besnoiti]